MVMCSTLRHVQYRIQGILLSCSFLHRSLLLRFGTTGDRQISTAMGPRPLPWDPPSWRRVSIGELKFVPTPGLPRLSVPLPCSPGTSLTEQNVSVSPSYACDGNRSQWTSMQWSWCCEQKGLACNNSNVSDTQAFDCTAEAAATWSERQRQWCCASGRCPSTSSTSESHQDTSTAAPTSTSVVADGVADGDCGRAATLTRAQRDWCCETRGVACQPMIVDPIRTDCQTSPNSWAAEKRAWCCQHEQRGCDVEAPTEAPFQCDGEMEGWTQQRQTWCCQQKNVGCKEVKGGLDPSVGTCSGNIDLWSLNKRLRCCLEKKVGCPEEELGDANGPSTTRMPSTSSTFEPFNCHADPVEDWPVQKQIWCCRTKELGCPLRRTSSAPFDCTTRDEWAPVKAQWCCWNMKVGCPEFDCEDGYSNWKMGFSERKKRYCCEHFGMACEEKFEEAEHYRCRGDPEEWSIDEKQWCCLVEHRGCLSEVEEELEATYDCSMSALSTASLQQSTWCCFEKGIGCEVESLAGNQWQQAQVQVEEEDDSSFYFVLLLLILLVMLIYNRAKGSCESRNRRTWSFGPSPQGTAYGRGVYSALGSRYTPPSLP
ncbi:unnamed protein product [Durusdinium trenchii]|uniref:Uncharacterized protein n=1 Tax=Durusdinium trenchii TaxID=1381693 RepID=A0ABP0PL45_9DINO